MSGDNLLVYFTVFIVYPSPTGFVTCHVCHVLLPDYFLLGNVNSFEVCFIVKCMLSGETRPKCLCRDPHLLFLPNRHQGGFVELRGIQREEARASEWYLTPIYFNLQDAGVTLRQKSLTNICKNEEKAYFPLFRDKLLFAGHDK